MTEEIENKDEEQTNIDEETSTSDETENTGDQGGVDNHIPYPRFKEKVDEVNELKERLAKIEEEREEAERKKLEEQEEYKELYERALAAAEKQKAEAIDVRKESLLAQAGYTEEQIEVLKGTVAGETSEEITKSVEELTEVIAPQKKQTYVDPSPMGGTRQDPKPEKGEGLGRSLYERVMGK